jgi:hypothetical protein
LLTVFGSVPGPLAIKDLDAGIPYQDPAGCGLHRKGPLMRQSSPPNFDRIVASTGRRRAASEDPDLISGEPQGKIVTALKSADQFRR